MQRTPFTPSMGRGTQGLLALLVGASLLAKVSERTLGFGTDDLIFTVAGVLQGEVHRVVTYAFVQVDAFGLILNALVLFFFGRFFEGQWGTRDFLKFFAISAVGAAILAIPLSFALQLLSLFNDVPMAAGPGPVFDAMLVSMAITLPNSNVMFGFMLPIRAKTLVYIVIGMTVVSGIMNGAASLSVTFGGLAMGYLLTTGIWRPDRLLSRVRTALSRRARRRRGLHVVPPASGPTLH